MYRRSTSTLIGTHGSTGTPQGCVTGTTQTTFVVPIAEVTTTTIANDLMIRVYGRESTNRATPIDLATVTGSTPYTAFTLNETVFRDRADTTVATTLWSIAAAATNYLSASNWATTFNVARYLKFSTSLFVPTGATITSADFVYSYRPNTNGNNNCWYFATYNGTTLLATRGAAAPISCDSTSASFTTDTVPIPESPRPISTTSSSACTTVTRAEPKPDRSRPGGRELLLRLSSADRATPRRAAARGKHPQEASGRARLDLCDLLGRPLGDDLSPASPPSGPRSTIQSACLMTSSCAR